MGQLVAAATNSAIAAGETALRPSFKDVINNQFHGFTFIFEIKQ